MSKEINTLLCNGKWFRDKNSIDPQVLMSLRRTKRFNIFHTKTEKLSVLEHLAMGTLLVDRYSDFMAENFKEGEYKTTYNDRSFRYYLMQGFITHDLEEIVLGDIPSPVDLPELDNIKIEIRSLFRNYLHISHVEMSDAIAVGIKHLDLITAFLEACEYDLFENIMKRYVSSIREAKLEKFVKDLGGIVSDKFSYYETELNNDALKVK